MQRMEHLAHEHPLVDAWANPAPNVRAWEEGIAYKSQDLSPLPGPPATTGGQPWEDDRVSRRLSNREQLLLLTEEEEECSSEAWIRGLRGEQLWKWRRDWFSPLSRVPHYLSLQSKVEVKVSAGSAKRSSFSESSSTSS